MWGIMKKFINVLFVCMAGILISCFLFSCVSTKAEAPVEEQPAAATEEKKSEETSVKKEEPKKENKAEFSKAGFVEELQQALRTGTAEDALKLYDKLPEKYAEDFDLLFLKASLFISAGRYADAKVICDSLSEKYPDNTDVMQLAAVIAKATGNTAEKNAQINALLEKDPKNAEANISLAEDALLNRSYKKAKKLYLTALSGDPTNETALLGYGETCYYTEDDEVSKSTMQKVIAQNPYNDEAYYYLAKLEAANSRYKVAADNIEKSIAIDGENYNYFLDYGMYLRYLGRFADAEVAWTKAVNIEPDYFLGYVYRAGLYDEENKFTEALADYKTIIKLNPDYYLAYESIGILAFHDKNWSEARKAFMKCREFNLDNISYPLMITYCYYMEGDKVNAKKYSDSVLRKMDRNSVEYTMLRSFHDETDKLPLLQKIASIDNSTKRGKMYFYLGLLYDMFGGTEFANEYYLKVVNMNSPMFFEYRIAEWKVGKVNNGN